ncbi:MAG: sensor histidine kinase [Microbacteriaceae bacterium]
MEQMLRERDRLLQRTSSIFGLSFTVVSALCLAIPGAVSAFTYLLAIPLYIILAASQYVVARRNSLLWVGTILASGIGLILAIVLSTPAPLSVAAISALSQLAAGSIASVAIVLTISRTRVALLVTAFSVVTVVSVLSFGTAASPIRITGLVLLGWILATIVGVWISFGVPQAARVIASIGRAHRAERQASELEAQRRQSARLLHDTVLATLTLLAHSGVGVAPDALKQQAADDARLLRQLRLGATPTPQSSGSYNLEPVEETVLGTTLESVKQRFGRMGLEVSWHGTGQVLLPSDVLDAFLLALAECLENVRRHSGVTEAHVTIVDSDTTVKAMITDAGVGFVLDDVDSARLGFKDSVVARLRDVGGQARLFSSPGSGTTVVLEVPR